MSNRKAGGNVRQRGIYSEQLGGNMNEDILQNATAGPTHSTNGQVQARPKARSFRGRGKAPSSKLSAVADKPIKGEVEPKVIVPYEQRAGKPPRRVEIERKKRLYASQDINELLVESGINYAKYNVEMNHQTGQKSYLPLDVFDDTEYEARNPEDWITLGTDKDGVCSIPAKALFFDADGKGTFKPCRVTAWDPTEKKFTLVWAPGSTETKLFRVHILFEAEDPFVYVQRVVKAHSSRASFEATIRYSLYVDHMPTDEIAPLDTEQVNRILLLALNTKKLKQNALDTTSLLHEINVAYQRTMNKIIFDVNLKDPNQQELKELLQLPKEPEEKPKVVPALGVVECPFHDLPINFSDFCFHSFNTKIEAITALTNTNIECLQLQKMNIFNTTISKGVRLEEFEQLQNSNMVQLNSFLKDKWSTALKKCIKDSLGGVGKGWFNLEEKNREVYQFSKLKKFMKMVNFMMEDALRFLVEDSTQKYLDFFRLTTNYHIDTRRTFHVDVRRGEELDEEATKEFKAAVAAYNAAEEKALEEDKDDEATIKRHKKADDGIERINTIPKGKDFALFNVDMVVQDGVIKYKTPESALKSTPLALFDKALGMLHDIDQLETSVMEQLFWYGNESKLASVTKGGENDEWVLDIFNEIERLLKDALKPMSKYLQHFDRYQPLVAQSIDDIVKEFADAEPGVDEIRTEILNAMSAKEAVEEDVPSQVWLGLVSINLEDVRSKLIEHHRSMSEKLLAYFAKETKAACDELGRDFKKIEIELRGQPENVQELVNLKDFIAQVPLQVSQQASAIDDAMNNFQVLNELGFKMHKDLSRLQWTTYAWPKTIHDIMGNKEVTLEDDREGFLKDMKAAQEEFDAEAIEIEKVVNTFGQYRDIDKHRKIADKVKEVQAKLNDFGERSRAFNNNEILFNHDATDYSHIRKINKNFEPYYQLWTTANDWLTSHDQWMQDAFMELDGEAINENATNWMKTIYKVAKAKSIKEHPECLAIANQIKAEVEEFKPLLPVIVALRNPGMRERHWDNLSEELPFDFKPDDTLTLTKVVEEYKLQDHLELISKVGEMAGKEFQIESALDKMAEAWQGIEFDVRPYKSTGTYVIGGVDEIMQLLDEHVVTTQAMTFSAFKKPFEERINRWSQKLTTVYEVIEEWLLVQRQWQSLVNIFSSPDINKQLPAEGKRFASVNKTWLITMTGVNTNPAVLKFCDNPGLLEKLQDANKLLNMVQKRLSEYLDKKRAAFSRFYFLANEELLQILSQTQDPTAVQPHLKKCFENVHKLRFTDEKLITSMFSGEGEEVPFTKSLNPNVKTVEYWLGDVEDEMKSTVKAKMLDAVNDYPNRPRCEWVVSHMGQTILNGSQLHWTKEVEETLRTEGTKGITNYHKSWQAQLLKTVAMVRGDLKKLERKVVEALIVLDVHARDVHARLVREEVKDPNDFAWMCQMRYYLEETNEIRVQMVQSPFYYQWEYLGNTMRLVITPLTDRCYMTLFSALALHLGGAPAGPAGTGKTETVKDLAKAVAKQCVVFNCSDGLNALAMSKFFKGLATSGAWACFDEFNRIDIEVLSVIAQQIMTIWEAVRLELEIFTFEETELKLNPTCCAFITMNPGYAGRTELPDNLEVLFRPVAMMVPDYALIGEIMLYSFGFENAKNLARKMVTTFTLCSEQLSAQDHYDYGMRAVKTVIVRAGILKRRDPTGPEDVLLLRALRDVNVPKFLAPDLPLFEGIISDLFPGVKPPEVDYGMLMDSIITSCHEKGLQPIDYFTEKCIQLFETVVVRHGLMVVGPTGGGKTSNIHTLKMSMTRLSLFDDYEKIQVYTMNPKAITMGQLYGDSDILTGEWTDGILATIMRTCIEDETPDKKWVVFDGPVDAIWIENMNTVLDDNKKLCLVSGEILQLTPHMSMIFEVEDLSVASPATVSRCGMVYMEPTALGLDVQVSSWLDRLHAVFSESKPMLRHLFDTYVESAIFFVRRQCAEPVPTVDNNLVKSCIQLMDAFLDEYIPIEGSKTNEDRAKNWAKTKPHIEALFLQSLIWSVGASTDAEGRMKFSNYLRKTMREVGCAEPPPKDNLVYDFCYNKVECCWVPWMDTAPPFKYDSRLGFAELIVPTMDSVRYSYLLKELNLTHKHILMTGDTGTGKTVNVATYLSTMPPEYTPLGIAFSAATSANQTEDLLFGKMTKRRARVYGPPLGKRFFVFVDDMNMPAREEYFAQPPIELLRQFMDHGGWYNRRALQFIELHDINFVGAMGPPGGGRNPVTPRFLRHFNQIAHTELQHSSLALIFGTIVSNSLVKYSDEVKEMANSIVEAAIMVYNTISTQLLPTPTKSHYTFNLRDLAKVFQGVLNGNPNKITEPAHVARLWVHENWRVFGDRLINDDDRNWLDELMGKTMKEHFGLTWEDTIPSECLMFGDYMGGVGAEQRSYDEITDSVKVASVVTEFLGEYNEQNAQMKLVMFLDAIEHVSRICRVLGSPGGNALLLGVGGSGRQSLTKLATFMSEYAMFRIEVSKSYGVTEWHDDMRQMLLDAGLKEQPTVFLFCDTQITHESFLEDVNGLLNSADIPNLYASEDMDNIFAACKVDCQRKGVPATKLNAFNQYIQRVKNNLHIVLAMSPLGDAFRTRIRMFPALVNCCTIDWFSDWPTAALISVADASLNDEEDLQLANPEGVVELFGFIHSSVTEESIKYKEELSRYNYVTPTSYLELLNVFKFLLKEKREEVGGLRHKLQFGLDRLADASAQVAKLQDDLTAKQPVLEKTQQQVAEMMVVIAKDTEEAEKTQKVVAVKEEAASSKANECNEIKNSAQVELDKALPMLDKAVECLKDLKKSDIDEVRNFKKPPGGVILTMEATCIMLQHVLKFKIAMKTDGMTKVPDYWATASTHFLKDAKLLMSTLTDYDKDNIPEKVIKKIEPYVKREEFSVAMVAKASVACKAICMWCHAMYSYHGVAKTVEPKRIMLREAEAELEVVMAGLNETRAELKQVEDKLAELNAGYQKAVDDSQKLEEDVEMCTLKLDRANKLIGGLGGESVRWKQSVEDLTIKYKKITGDILVSAGAIAYLGAFTANYREKLCSMWRDRLVELKIEHTEGCDVIKTLADPVQIRAWNIAGLPTDSVSTENGIIMSKARRWPLMIDPQGQAGKFIRNLGAQKFEDGMTICKQTDKSFLQNIENCVQFGRWVLVEGILEDIDPSLEPILLQQFVKINNSAHVKIGEKMVPYSDDFHLYQCTTLPNPHYAPELQVKVTLLNFTITPGGLQDQMLGVVVAKEMPEMEAKKNNLTIENARMKKELQDIEDKILQLLSEAKGDILEDETLINVLAESKVTSKEINEKVAEAEIITKDIDVTRTGYIPVAERASLLYFCIADLNRIDPMYQYSLQWFVQLFIRGIATAEASTELEERLENLNSYFTLSLYQNVCRSLFEVHKMLFSLLLAVNISQGQGKVKALEWRHLVAGAATKKEIPNPASDWLSIDQWTNVLALSDMDAFEGFEQTFIENLPSFKRFCDSVEPYNEQLPAPWHDKLDTFQKLLPLRALRPDKMTPALQNYITESLGEKYNSPPQFDLAMSFNDSSNVSPLIFVLSRGADPTNKLLEFAKESGVGADRFNKISLGQGQGPIAQRFIEEGVKRGGWVLLQNCHLAVSWLPALEVICESLKPEEVHEEFRLWLTSMPTPKFPVSMLQNGVKMTNEPAKGLRANLLQSYYSLTDQSMNRSSKPECFKKLLFSLCFFHAIILDRRKFGPLGWNIPYAFGENDLDVCITQLREFIDMYDDIPYTVIHFLAYDVNYGGRVTDNKDRRTLMTILDDYMNPNVQDDDYKFSASGKYCSIPAGDKASYVEYIESMDHVPEPEIFGLHDNAEITSAKEETQTLFSTILVLLPKAAAGAGKSREEVLDEIATNILAKLPPEWELESVQKRYPTLYSESMNTVLVQEVARYNRLLVVIKKTLEDLKKALVGLVVMSGDLEKMADSCFNNLVPNMWADVAYPSLMPLAAWFTDLIARCAFIQKWIDDGTPICFWISGFFFPQAFLTGSLQNYARKTKKPIDAISFGFKVEPREATEIKERPEDGIYVYGLYLQGCRFDADSNTLCDSNPKELFTTFPVMWLIPQEERKKPETGIYNCPVYKVLTRRGTLSTTGHSTNFVLFMEVPTEAEERKWIKAGVALFCALTY